MGNESNGKKLTASATTTLASVLCFGIGINKTLSGTVTVNDGNTNIAIFAIGVVAGTYHAIPNGVRYSNLAIALSTTDDVTAFTRSV